MPTTPRKSAAMVAAPYAGPDPTAVKELVANMKTTLANLNQNSHDLREQSARANALGPKYDPSVQLNALKKQIREQGKRQSSRIDDVRGVIKDVLKEQIADHMRQQIEEQIKTELALQVGEEVHRQLPEHIPEDGDAQSKTELTEARVKFVNSESRGANAVLREQNLEDPLHDILRSDGTKSELFPPDLKTLFAYNADKVRQLVQDYGVPEHHLRERNLNRFMAYCGVAFHMFTKFTSG